MARRPPAMPGPARFAITADAGGRDQRRIHQRAGAPHHPLRLPLAGDSIEQHPIQPTPHQLAAEPHERRPLRCRLMSGEAAEAAEAGAVVQRLGQLHFRKLMPGRQQPSTSRRQRPQGGQQHPRAASRARPSATPRGRPDRGRSPPSRSARQAATATRPRAAPTAPEDPPDQSDAAPYPPPQPDHGIESNCAASTQDLPRTGLIIMGPDHRQN